MPLPKWSAWMVQYAKKNRPLKFKFAEDEAEALKLVEEFKAYGFVASCWKL